MRSAGDIIPINIRGLRDIADTVGAVSYNARRYLADVELVAAPGFQHLRTGFGRVAFVEHAARRKAAALVREVCPPGRRFVAAHVEVADDIGLRPTRHHPQHLAADDHPLAFKDLAVRFILVEAIGDQAVQERAGL